MKPHPPDAEVERMFVDVLAGRRTREDADRWATQIFHAQESGRLPEHLREALNCLCLMECRHGPGEAYLYSDEQIAEWLAEFRKKMAA